MPARLLSCALLLLAATGALASPTLDRIRSNGTIVLAYREAAAPFSFRERDGRVRGYSVELCERVVADLQKTLGLPKLAIEWRAVDASTRLDAVARGTVDAECGTTTITISRMKEVDFSVPIFVEGASVLVRSGAKIRNLADLANKRIAVIGGTTTERALTDSLSRLGVTAVLVPVRDGPEGIGALLGFKADAYAGDRLVLATLRERAQGMKKLEFIPGDFSYEPYAIVVRRDDPDFRLEVNRTLTGLYRSGGIDPIFQRWFGTIGQPGPLLHSMFYLSALPE